MEGNYASLGTSFSFAVQTASPRSKTNLILRHRLGMKRLTKLRDARRNASRSQSMLALPNSNPTTAGDSTPVRIALLFLLLGLQA